MGTENYPQVKAAGVECLAMAIFVYVCCGTAATNLCCSNSDQVVAVSLAFGFSIMVLAHCIGHISGGHINPAVTLGLVITKRIEWRKGLSYVFAQFVGSMIGSLLLYASLPKVARSCLGSNTVGGGGILFTGQDADYSVGQAFLLEAITTFILVFTVMATIDPANSMTQRLGVFPIGMAVFICHLLAIPLTGCGINPARSFGPGIVAYAFIGDCGNVLDDHWVFWFGPFLGATVAALGYEHLVQEHQIHLNMQSVFHSDAYRKLVHTAGKVVDSIKDDDSTKANTIASIANSLTTVTPFNEQQDGRG